MKKRRVEAQETIRSSSINLHVMFANVAQYEASEVINTDQSGIQPELHSTRILSHKEEKVTTGFVRSVNATTHSYTCSQQSHLMVISFCRLTFA